MVPDGRFPPSRPSVLYNVGPRRGSAHTQFIDAVQQHLGEATKHPARFGQRTIFGYEA